LKAEITPKVSFGRKIFFKNDEKLKQKEKARAAEEGKTTGLFPSFSPPCYGEFAWVRNTDN
jgi:hypothetical protein